MFHPRPQSRLQRLTMVLGLLLLGLGVVCSCASTNTHTRNGGDPRAIEPDSGIDQPEAGTEAKHETDRPPRQDPDHAEPVAPETEPDSSPVDENGAHSDVRVEIQAELRAALETIRTQREELKALYRRLHIELDTPGRSALIVELFNDPRTELRLLGFDLADRDLSASKDLGVSVGQTVRGLLSDKSPQIRAKAARLITRLVPPDGMMVLTGALQRELDPLAAEPMLLGIARWPNGDAREAVLAWFTRDDAPLVALCSAAWAMEREAIWDAESDHQILLARLRTAKAEQLREDGMKLLAKLGTSEDLGRLVRLMLSADASVVRWAATALVETPRSVEVLTASAMENEVLYQAAGEALIKHRSTPEGLRRLAQLPQSDRELRRRMLVRMGQTIERERLGEAVRLAELEPEISIEILGRLVSSEHELTTRSAKGVLQLAELELEAGRPNRVNEALLALEGVTLDPADQSRYDALRVQSLILLGRLDEAVAISKSWEDWEAALRRTSDDAQRARIAQYLLGQDGLGLDESQILELEALLPPDATPQTTPPEDG